MIPQRVSEPSTPSVSPVKKKLRDTSALLQRSTVYRGIHIRVAQQIGVSRSIVSRVARGKKKSARISAALAAEVEKVEKQLALSGGTKKQHLTFRVFFDHNGETFAIGHFPHCGLIVIGRTRVEAAS